ncbi:hypothetical protein PG987_011561 [Apiospora arundinis]
MAVAVAPPLPQPLFFENTPLLNPTLPRKPNYHGTMKKLTVQIPIRPASRVSQVQPPLPPAPQQEQRAVNNTSNMATAPVNGDIDIVNNEDESTRRASNSYSGSFCTCDTLSPLSTHCEYCVRNGVDHNPHHRVRDWMATMEEGRLYDASFSYFPPYTEEQQRRSAWTRCTENEGMLGFLEFMIALQMRLLAIVVPTSLLFVFLFVWYQNNVDTRGLFR